MNEIVAGRYQLERLLARGGMGEVFAAVDQSTGRRVALKRVLQSQPGSARSPAVYFMREYYALSELRHPRIIEVYDYGVDHERPYYTMELLDGQDLRELSPVPYREACRYLRDVASSLALLHARRLLHRDLSPRNVRRTSDGRCKLLDFGAMVPFGVPPNLIGTPAFIPPEALQGGPLDQRSDLYALGALAYFVLTGRLARPATDVAALQGIWTKPFQRPMRIVGDIPAPLDELVIALLSIDSMQRPSSAAEVIERLSAAAELESQDDELATARSFLSAPRLVGRAAQTARLRRHVTKTLEGHGSAALLCGDGGMGRSRMLAEAALLGQTAGMTVVRMVARSHGAVGGLASELVQALLRAAPIEAQRASATRPTIAAHSFAADSSDSRAQLLRELTAFVEEVARARPVMITVDDLERADEFSGSLVAALAHQSSDCPLSIIATYDSRQPAPVVAQIPNLADAISLAPLSRAQTLDLAVSLFGGGVPNLERVGDWLHRVAAGSPKVTMQLAEHLLAQGVVRYVDGTWVLPSQVDQQLPPSTAAALLQQLHGLSTEARALAELLCASRAGASVERILELSQQPPALILRALEELVQRGVLENARNAYAFAQEALRETLQESLDSDHRQQLHLRWANCLLSRKPNPEDQLQAGWHLVHTSAELRGADILAKIAPDWVERRVNMAVAVPALERALEIYTRHNRPLAQQLHLRSLLVMSAFLFDYRLARRHADATLDALFPFTGLALAERWSRIVGNTAGFVLAIGWTVLRWFFLPHKTRGPHVLDALKYYGRAAMGLVGLRALAVDPQGTRAALERLRAFGRIPHPSAQLLFALAQAITMHLEGRGADARELVQSVMERLSPEKAPLRMTAAERIDLLCGALLLEGINECYHERSRALDYVKRLEELGTPMAAAAAMRISMTYYMVRGETERTQHYRRLMDLSAIENGTVWQIDWITLSIEGLSAVLWSDLVMMRRAYDAVNKMVTIEPGFASERDTIRIAYHFRRGDFALVARDGEVFMKTYPPFSRLGWPSVYAFIALAHLELGNTERARSISEQAYALLNERHREYLVLHSSLEAAYAASLIVSGERQRGEQMFRALLDRLRASGEPTRALLMYEYRVKVARLLNDPAAVHAALHDMREVALASGNPSAILLADAVSALHARMPSSAPPPASELNAPGDDETQDAETLVTIYLRGEQAFQRRAQQAIRILAQCAGSSEAYIFWVKRDALELAASLDRREPPSDLERALAVLPANDQRAQQAVTLYQNPQRTFIVVPFHDRTERTVGFAAIGGATLDTAIPTALISDVGQALLDCSA